LNSILTNGFGRLCAKAAQPLGRGRIAPENRILQIEKSPLAEPAGTLRGSGV
jgi:hypothetical protein